MIKDLYWAFGPSRVRGVVEVFERYSWKPVSALEWDTAVLLGSLTTGTITGALCSVASFSTSLPARLDDVFRL